MKPKHIIITGLAICPICIVLALVLLSEIPIVVGWIVLIATQLYGVRYYRHRRR